MKATSHAHVVLLKGSPLNMAKFAHAVLFGRGKGFPIENRQLLMMSFLKGCPLEKIDGKKASALFSQVVWESFTPRVSGLWSLWTGFVVNIWNLVVGQSTRK